MSNSTGFALFVGFLIAVYCAAEAQDKGTGAPLVIMMIVIGLFAALN